MLRDRLVEGLESRLARTQYGFRSTRRTAQPIFAARRLMDIAESAGDRLILLLLDWEKAFDKIDQEALFEAMDRMDIDPKLIRLTKQLYKNPKFKIELEGLESEWHTQSTGIRQGCPLSPYLFLIRFISC